MDDSSDEMSIDSFNSDSFDFEYDVSSDDSVSLDTNSDATISGDDEPEKIFFWANPVYEPYDDEKSDGTFHQVNSVSELQDNQNEKRGMKRSREYDDEDDEDDELEYPNKNQKTDPSLNAQYMAWYVKEHEKEMKK